MKIAILCFPQVSAADILTFMTPIELLKQQQPALDLTWEYCSYLPMNNGKPGFSLTPSFVGLPLQGFDFLFLPNPRVTLEYPQDDEWLEWINTAVETPIVFSQDKGKVVLWKSQISPEKIVLNDSPFSSVLFALDIIEKIAGLETKSSIRSLLNLDALPQTNSTPRTASVDRKSAETKIQVHLKLDGEGKSNIHTGIAFLDHMLAQISRHGLFDIDLQARGDLEIDPHHTMEDTALTLGEAFRLAAGDRKGIRRMATMTVPMDESLAEVSLDFSGRPYAVLQTQWADTTLAEIPTSLFEHFLESFASAARINLFVRVLAGKDNHHMSEAIFKALARTLDTALTIDARRSDMIPSTKEILF